MWRLSLLLVLAQASPPEARLLNDLLSGYVQEERPVLDSKKPVDVKLGVIMQNIINMNEKEEQLEVNAWLKYQWTDENLRWDPQHYENVSDLRHPAGSVWQPDVLLYNSVDSSFDSTYKVNIVGYSNGIMEWMPPGIFKISCKLDVTYFPFDTQLCWFKFGSWTHSANQVNMSPGTFDFSDFMENSEWIIESAQSFGAYICRSLGQHDFEFYAFNLIMPCMITMVLAVLGFTLRAESGEKVGLQISVCLAITFFQTLMKEMTPQTSEAMRYILLEWGPWLLRMEVTKRENNLRTIKSSWKERRKQKEDERKTAPVRMMAALSSSMKENADNLISQFRMCDVEKKDKALAERLRVLEKIYDHVKLIRENNDDAHEDKLVECEWRFAARVVDRLGLITFSLLLLVTTMSIGLKAPYLAA